MMDNETESLVKSFKKSENAAGLSILKAALFIIGDLVGVGILTLPKALDNTGWSGVVLIVTYCFATGVSGVVLGRCWTIIEERYPEEIRGQIIRKPFPKIAEKAFGKWMSSFVAVNINISLSGTTCVLLITAAQNAESFLQYTGVTISSCYLMIIFAGVLTPVLWLGSPKDFWPVGVGSAISIGLATFLIVIQLSGLIPSHANTVKMFIPSLETFFLGLGAMSFAVAGIDIFPTLQQDMKKPSDFEKSAIIGFSAVSGYLAFGDGVETNILQNLPNGRIKVIIEVLITVHCLCSAVFMLTPVASDFENLFKIPPGFSFQRCVVRTSLFLSLLLICESFPDLGALVDLIGGSVYSFLNFVAPGLLYLRLTSMKGDWPDSSIPLHLKVLLIEIVVVGIFGGILSTYSAIKAIANKTLFSAPCFSGSNNM